MNRLKEKYQNEVTAKLQEEFGIKNRMAVPRVDMVVVHISLGEAKDDAGILNKVKIYMLALAGQQPVITYAKKSISSFKVAKGQPVGMMVTLRGNRMYSFLDKLINIALPKVRDFKGVAASGFDGTGNLNIGIREQIIFPEVDYKSVDKVRGLAVTIVTTARQKDHALKLLELLGMPFRS